MIFVLNFVHYKYLFYLFMQSSIDYGGILKTF